MPDELAHRIDFFTARGELAPLEDESLPPDSWRALLIGHGILPESWRPAADRVPPDAVKAHFRKMLGFVREAVDREERRVGKECVRTCSFRWSPAHEKTKRKQITT